MKFYEQIHCEHGRTDELGWAICDLGSGCSIDMKCFCTKEDCPIYEEDDTPNAKLTGGLPAKED